MNIQRIIANKGEIKDVLIPIIENEFSIAGKMANNAYDNSIKQHIEPLLDTVWVFVETPYVDKVFRDSYYTYFSSKLRSYHKNCIRLCIFNGEISDNSFKTEAGIIDLQSRYLGFMVIRPTAPNYLGRSVVSPKGLKNNHFLCIDTEIHNTVNSIKFVINGFPHSSQDTETITCAETTLWAIMEYYGNKYAEYKPILPSKIITSLKQLSAERQVPSKGLNIQQMAYALKVFGFGTKIYSSNEFKGDFKKLFSTYIESGIPIIVALENRMHGGNIGHAILSIGHERITDSHIDNLKTTIEHDSSLKTIISNKNILLYDNDDIVKDYVFIDDNCPIYQLAKIDTPTIHYPDKNWHKCEISYFIVPLYQKMYLEAYEAKSFFKNILLNVFTDIPNDSELFIRFFLTSSRSFKHELTLKSSFNNTIKELILEIAMPKFIWIGEVSNKTLIKNKEANGIFIIDATEANLDSLKPLIFASYLNDSISFDEINKMFTKKALPLGTFSIFTNNLKGF